MLASQDQNRRDSRPTGPEQAPQAIPSTIQLPSLTVHGDTRLSSVTFQNITAETQRAHSSMVTDPNHIDRIAINGTTIAIPNLRELLDQMIHTTKIGGQVLDGNGAAVTDYQSFIADYARLILNQMKDFDVFKTARYAVFDLNSRKVSYADGFCPSVTDVKAKTKIVWLDLVVADEHSGLYSSNSKYLLQRLAAAAMYLQAKKPADNHTGSIEQANPEVAVFKLPFPEIKERELIYHNVHVCIGESTLATVRSQHNNAIKNEFDQFHTSDISSSGCIFEYILNRSIEAVRQVKRAICQDLDKLEGQAATPKKRANLQNLQDGIFKLDHALSPVTARLAAEKITLGNLFVNSPFHMKWEGIVNNISAELSQLNGRITAELAQVAGLLQDQYEARHVVREARRERTNNLFVTIVGAASIIQGLQFLEGAGDFSLIRGLIAAAVVAIVVPVFLRGMNRSPEDLAAERKLNNGANGN